MKILSAAGFFPGVTHPFQHSLRHFALLRLAGLAALLILGAVLSGPTSTRAEEPKTPLVKSVLRLDPEIDCPSCEDGIKHALVTARGVQSAEVDVLTNRIVVRYDPARIRLPALVGRIRVCGYTATEVK